MIKPFKMPLTKRQRFAFLPVSIFATPSPYTEKTGAVVCYRNSNIFGQLGGL
jgi:hypothetical protein